MVQPRRRKNEKHTPPPSPPQEPGPRQTTMQSHAQPGAPLPVPPPKSSTPRPRVNGKPDTSWQPVFLHWLELSGNVHYSCRQAGISPPTAHKYRRDDKEFSRAWHRAQDAAIEALMQSAREQAMGITATGELPPRGNERLMVVLLKAHRPDLFGDSEEYGQKANNVQVVISMPANDRDVKQVQEVPVRSSVPVQEVPVRSSVPVLPHVSVSPQQLSSQE